MYYHPINLKDPIYFSRVCISIAHRNHGIGRRLIQQVLDYIRHQFPQKEIVISAQTYLEKFYNSFDFVRVGTPYEEDNIPHIAMRLSANK